MVKIFYNLEVNDSSLKYCLYKYFGVTPLDFLNLILVPLNEKNKDLELRDLDFDNLLKLDSLLDDIQSYRHLKRSIEDDIKSKHSQRHFSSKHIANSEFVKAVNEKISKLEKMNRPLISIFYDDYKTSTHKSEVSQVNNLFPNRLLSSFHTFKSHKSD